jgi:hypothetical protein
MKTITLKIFVAVVGSSLVGCADLARKFATSDGLTDFILAVSGNGAGWVTTAWSHVDVIVLDSKSRHLQSLATKFFPSTVPETQRGIRGRSSYFVRLPTVPPVGSTIIVAFHQVPIIQCEY